MKKRSRTLLWVRRVVIALVFIAFAIGMTHWYFEVKSVNARAAAQNARLAAFIEGRATMQAAVGDGDYRGAITDGLALRGTIALYDWENVDVLTLEGFAYFKLAEDEAGTARWNDLRASRDAYAAALAGLDGARDARYASICFSLGGVYFALADYEDETASLQTALDYYRLNAAYDGPQAPAVQTEVSDKIAYLVGRLQG
jgi:hypothetical protein